MGFFIAFSYIRITEIFSNCEAECLLLLGSAVVTFRIMVRDELDNARSMLKAFFPVKWVKGT